MEPNATSEVPVVPQQPAPEAPPQPTEEEMKAREEEERKAIEEERFNFIPPGSQRFLVEFGKYSKKGCSTGRNAMNIFHLSTDHENNCPSGKAMSNVPLIYDAYKQNTYYFQFKIVKNYDEPDKQPGAQSIPTGIKISVGFCRDNLDLNKNSIVENKKKEYYVFDLFDGELYTSHLPGLFNKYVPDDNLFKENDIVGIQIDLEMGEIEFFKNSVSLGAAFNEGGSFKKGKLYPFVALYKCMISVY